MLIKGEVVRRTYAAGSKSERDAVMVDSDDGSFVLRRAGGSAFSDPELDRLVGRKMRFEGTLVGSTFIYTSVQPDDRP